MVRRAPRNLPVARSQMICRFVAGPKVNSAWAFISAASILLAAWLVEAPVVSAQSAEPIVGKMAARDGDTLLAGDRELDLFGIDAPEKNQDCRTPNGTLHCGLHAAAALQKKIAGKVISCYPHETMDKSRTRAVCYKGIEDLSTWIVLQGWAVAARHESADYVKAEEAARKGRKNIWRTKFVPPWKWRKGERLP